MFLGIVHFFSLVLFVDFPSFVWDRRKFFFLCRKRWCFENILLYNLCVKTGKVKKRPIKFNYVFFFFVFILFDLGKKYITFHQNLVSMGPFHNMMENDSKTNWFMWEVWKISWGMCGCSIMLYFLWIFFFTTAQINFFHEENRRAKK